MILVLMFDRPEASMSTRSCRAFPIAHTTLTCTSCGTTAEVELDVLGLLGTAVVRGSGFDLLSHRLELRGRCAGCVALAGPMVAQA